jgi:hypothetical protein
MKKLKSVLILFTILISTPVYALDIPEAYLSLFKSSTDKIVVDDPGNLFQIHFRNDSENSTTTAMYLSNGKDMYIGTNISRSVDYYPNLVVGNDAFSTGGSWGHTVIGHNSLHRFTSGEWNTALGSGSGYNFLSGGGNTFIGSSAGNSNPANGWSGINNTFIGINSGSGIANGSTLSHSTIIGANAASYQSVGSGEFNILIGAGTNLPNSNGSYQLNIGNVIYGKNISGIQYDISPGTIGVGTTSPLGRFSIQANDGETNTQLFVIASSTSSESITLYSIDNLGHHTYRGPTPTISSCGTGGSIQGNDSRGRIITGSSTGTSCVLVFANPWANAPICTVNQEVGGNKNILAVPSSTSTTFKSGSTLNNIVFTYSCDGF